MKSTAVRNIRLSTNTSRETEQNIQRSFLRAKPLKKKVKQTPLLGTSSSWFQGINSWLGIRRPHEEHRCYRHAVTPNFSAQATSKKRRKN